MLKFFFLRIPRAPLAPLRLKKHFKICLCIKCIVFQFFFEWNGAKGTLVAKRYSKKILIFFFFTLWYLIVQFFFQIFDYRGDPKKILIELGPLCLSEDLVDNMVIWEAQCTPGQPHIYI